MALKILISGMGKTRLSRAVLSKDVPPIDISPEYELPQTGRPKVNRKTKGSEKHGLRKIV